MASSEIQHLVSMTNDIAANLASYDDCSKRVADHIKRFWTPRMRSLLLDFVAAGGDGLSEGSLDAVQYLQDVD